MLEYLIWLFIFIVTPIVLMLIIFRKVLIKYTKIIIFIAGISAIFGIVWDIVAVNFGAWYFPRGTNLGIIIVNFPFEEILFTISVSIWIVVVTIILVDKK